MHHFFFCLPYVQQRMSIYSKVTFHNLYSSAKYMANERSIFTDFYFIAMVTYDITCFADHIVDGSSIITHSYAIYTNIDTDDCAGIRCRGLTKFENKCCEKTSFLCLQIDVIQWLNRCLPTFLSMTPTTIDTLQW